MDGGNKVRSLRREHRCPLFVAVELVLDESPPSNELLIDPKAKMLRMHDFPMAKESRLRKRDQNGTRASDQLLQMDIARGSVW